MERHRQQALLRASRVIRTASAIQAKVGLVTWTSTTQMVLQHNPWIHEIQIVRHQNTESSASGRHELWDTGRLPPCGLQMDNTLLSIGVWCSGEHSGLQNRQTKVQLLSLLPWLLKTAPEFRNRGRYAACDNLSGHIKTMR